MSIIEVLHQEHKQRLARIASRAVVEPPPPVKQEEPEEPQEKAKIPFMEWAAHERAWEIELLHCGDYESPRGGPPIRKIQDVVCRHYGVSRDDMLSARRTADLIEPRHVAIYLARRLTPHALPKLGRSFGNRDHTTILHAFRKIGARIEKDKSMREVVETLAYRIEGGRA
jgi:hypothetical protein